MLSTGFIALSLLAAVSSEGQMKPSEPEAVKQIVKQVADSGRCATLAEAPDKRVDPPAALPPGPPPLLSFRFYESKAHHRVGNSELMLDDAGH